MDILFLGAGRRISLLERFQKKGFYTSIYELDNKAPAVQIAATPDFLSEKDACAQYPWYLACMDKLTVLDYPNYIGSPYTTSNICYDKFLFEKIVGEAFPDIYPKPKMWDTKIIKPRFGNGSKGLRTAINHTADIDFRIEVVQKKITGIEYSVDCYFNRDGKWVGGVSRVRDRVAGGEVVDSTVHMNYPLLDKTEEIGTFLNMRGPACFQFFITPDDEIKIIEINARLGGGVICSIEAGLDIPEYIKQEYYLETQVKRLPVSRIKDGLVMRRVNREFFF